MSACACASATTRAARAGVGYNGGVRVDRRRGQMVAVAMAAAGALLISATVALAGPSPQRTVRVRQAPGEPNGRSSQPSLSGDARFVAFSSAATNLGGAGDANGAVSDVFVFDQGSGSVRLASAGL